LFITSFSLLVAVLSSLLGAFCDFPQLPFNLAKRNTWALKTKLLNTLETAEDSGLILNTQIIDFFKYWMLPGLADIKNNLHD